MRKLFIIPAISLLTSCGGGSESSPVAAHATQGACGLPYYSELIGVYAGTLTRDSGTFYVDMGVSGENRDGQCYLSFNLTTESTQQDIGIHGSVMTLVDAAGHESFWSDPVWPVDGWAQPASAIPEGPTVAGEYGANILVMTFDGQGGVSLDGAEGSLSKSP